MTQLSNPRRWTVPRPGPGNEPVGALVIEVVPAQSYDILLDEIARLRETNARYGNALEHILSTSNSVLETGERVG